MYSNGENFSYEIDDEEQELTVIGDVIIKGKEYLIAEDYLDNNFVFIFNEDSEEIELIEDEELSEYLIDSWQEEYYGTIDEVGLWEEDYEEDTGDDFSENLERYYEIDENLDSEEDLDSYIDDLMDTESEE